MFGGDGAGCAAALVALEANGASGPTLMYFKSALTPPQRRIAITAECMTEVVPTDRSHRTFVVQTPRETLWLQGFNETDAQIWVQRLQLAIRAAAQHAGRPRHDVGRKLFADGVAGPSPAPVKPRRRRTFERSHRSRTNRHNAPPSLAARTDRVNAILPNLNPFPVHFMVRNILNTHRLKGACPHMKGHKCSLHTFKAESREQGLVEVKTCSRRCNSALMLCIDGLITLTVLWCIRALNVRR